ncbi:hypothetical protein ACFVYC_19945 [Pseudarthrobacter sp. NPDC058329]|uniref:hypothetical protein n=1 Tax=Pseudarthrobacter sp. NPDC058329 TaxID=3346448 RepID=UPI0036DB703C
MRTENGSLLLRPDCTVETAEGEVGLDREEAQLATTAAALLGRGMEAPDTSGIDESVLQRLADGPPENAGPTLACRGSAARDGSWPTGSSPTPRTWTSNT